MKIIRGVKEYNKPHTHTVRMTGVALLVPAGLALHVATTAAAAAATCYHRISCRIQVHLTLRMAERSELHRIIVRSDVCRVTHSCGCFRGLRTATSHAERGVR